MPEWFALCCFVEKLTLAVGQWRWAIWQSGTLGLHVIFNCHFVDSSQIRHPSKRKSNVNVNYRTW